MRLTTLSHGGGCGCKLGPADLHAIVSRLPRPTFPDLLVGVETSDDAAVWRISDDKAIVSTLDFFMPVVDDARDFGRIAATNAISDVYAMGGTPLSALAIVGFPVGKMPNEVMAEILAGGAEACAAVGIAIVGGHSIDDTEPKFGLAVTGLVDPRAIWRNSTAQEGDLLVLTKPLGVGTHASAVKKQVLDAPGYADLLRVTTFANRVPADAARPHAPSACTDVTGFGLLGHGLEMAAGAGLSLELWIDAVPELAQARPLLASGVVPGATRRILDHAAARTVWGAGVLDLDRLLIADPQTSGGLLFAVPPERHEALVGALTAAGALAAATVGRFGAPTPGGAVSVVRRG